MTFYELLEVSENASTDVIIMAHHVISEKYRLNEYGNLFISEKLKQLDLALYTLSDSSRRLEYDDFLMKQRVENNKANDYESKEKNALRANDRKVESFLEKIKTSHLVIIFAVLLAITIFVFPYEKLTNNSRLEDDTIVVTEESKQTTSYYATTMKPMLTPVSAPMSGTVLTGVERTIGSEITVTADFGSSYVVKLKTVDKTEVISFYVRAGDTVTVIVPETKLYVYFASGEIWYGNEYLFGDETSYSMDSELHDFREYTIKYTLYEMRDGNFKETTIDKNEF